MTRKIRDMNIIEYADGEAYSRESNRLRQEVKAGVDKKDRVRELKARIQSKRLFLGKELHKLNQLRRTLAAEQRKLAPKYQKERKHRTTTRTENFAPKKRERKKQAAALEKKTRVKRTATITNRSPSEKQREEFPPASLMHDVSSSNNAFSDYKMILDHTAGWFIHPTGGLFAHNREPTCIQPVSYEYMREKGG